MTKWLPSAILDIRNSLWITISDQYRFCFDKMAAGGHFGCPKITFDLIYMDIFDKMAAVGHFGYPKFTLDHILAISDQYRFFFTKWLPAAILDGRKSLSISFISISHRYATLIFFGIFLTKWLPSAILDVRKSVSIAFLAISDWYATIFILEMFDKMAVVGHFGCPKFTFDRISGHFRSIWNYLFYLWQNGRRRTCWMFENRVWLHLWPFQSIGHFGCLKFISDPYGS